jgi:iron complex transport system permease protein
LASKTEHKNLTRHYRIFLPVIVVSLVLVSLNMGPYSASIFDVYDLVTSFITGEKINTTLSTVLFQLRLPRICASLIVGFAMAICGTIMQTLLGNPLASPYTLGISTAAAFGTSLAVLMNISLTKGLYLIMGNSFVFSLIPVVLILFVSRIKSSSKETFILTGIAINFLFSSGTTTLQYFSEADKVYNLIFWLSGNMQRSTWEKNIIIFIITSIAYIVFILKSNDLNIMNTGDRSTQSLGVNAGLLRIGLLLLLTMIVGTLTSFFGIISFVGLVAPHLGRMMVGSDHRTLIPVSGGIGMILLLVADMISTNLFVPVVLPLSAVTSIIGVPFFLYLILKRKTESW